MAGPMLDPSMEPGSNRVRSTSDWRMRFVADHDDLNHTLGNGSMLRFVFPSGFTLDPNLSNCSFLEPITVRNYNATVLPPSELRCGLGDNDTILRGNNVSVLLRHIGNPSGALSRASVFVQLLDSNGTVVGNDTRELDIEAADLGAVNVTAAVGLAGAEDSYAFGFTSGYGIPAKGNVTIDFPSGFTVLPTARCRFDGNGTQGSSSDPISNQALVCRRGSNGTDPGEFVGLQVSGVLNPPASGTYGPIRISIQSGTDGASEMNATATVSIAANNETTLAEATAANPSAGAMTDYTFTFTLVNDWAPDGALRVTLPAGVGALTGGSDAVDARLTGGAVESLDFSREENRTLLFQRTGTNTLPGGLEVSVVVTNLWNPPLVGETGNFTLETVDAEGRVQDSWNVLVATKIAPSPIRAANTDTPATSESAEARGDAAGTAWLGALIAFVGVTVWRRRSV